MNPSQPRIEDSPATADLSYLEEEINTFNIKMTGAHDYLPLAAFMRHDDGEIIAGISGYTWAGLCEIQFLWVHETMRGRGYGARLLSAVEQEAASRGCQLVTLSSYTFQAPEFYRRHGYEVVGTVKDCPPGHAHVHLKKHLQPLP